MEEMILFITIRNKNDVLLLEWDCMAAEEELTMSECTECVVLENRELAAWTQLAAEKQPTIKVFILISRFCNHSIYLYLLSLVVFKALPAYSSKYYLFRGPLIHHLNLPVVAPQVHTVASSSLHQWSAPVTPSLSPSSPTVGSQTEDSLQSGRRCILRI